MDILWCPCREDTQLQCALSVCRRLCSSSPMRHKTYRRFTVTREPVLPMLLSLLFLLHLILLVCFDLFGASFYVYWAVQWLARDILNCINATRPKLLFKASCTLAASCV